MASDKELDEYVAFVKENANKIDGLSKKEVRSVMLYDVLSKRYSNLDDLIMEIYNNVDLLGVWRDWVKNYWEKRRLEFMYDCRGEQHYEEAIRAYGDLIKNEPNMHKRLVFKYKPEALILSAYRVMCQNPWSFSDVCRDSDLRGGIIREEDFYGAISAGEAASLKLCKDSAEDIPKVCTDAKKASYGYEYRKPYKKDSAGNVIAPKKHYVSGRIN